MYSVIPIEAAAPALVIVGALMIRQVRRARGIHPLMWAVAVLFVGYFAEGAIGSWLDAR